MAAKAAPQNLLVLGHHDLDGIVSAAVAGAFLLDRFPDATARFGTVDFHLKESWSSFWRHLGTEKCSWRSYEQAPKPDGIAIVDFLFTEVPGDVFHMYADHHPNSFDVPGCGARLRDLYATRERSGSPVFHDASAGSCARMLVDVLRARFGWTPSTNITQAVDVAHLVDTAGYSSAHSALNLQELAPVLDLLSVSLSERAAGDAIGRLVRGADLREAMIEPNQAFVDGLLARAHTDLHAYAAKGNVNEHGLAVWDFTEEDGPSPNRVKFAEFRNPNVRFAAQLHCKQLPDGTFLVSGFLGRSPWLPPLPAGTCPPDLSKVAKSIAGGGGQPFAAGFRMQSPLREVAVARARAALNLMTPLLRPLEANNPLADATGMGEVAPVRVARAALRRAS